MEEREMVTLLHESGVEFNVYLTAYEIEKCEEGGEISRQIMQKYFELYKKGLIIPANSSTTHRDETHNQNINLSGTDMNSCSTGEEENLPTLITPEAEEYLINCVAQWPPLYDFRLPLAERSKTIVRNLWEQVISDMNVNMTVDAISKKWKNIRDSYIRARANVNKKICSGSSVNEKIAADKIRDKHKNYEILKFLDDTLATRPTTSNLTNNEDEILDPSASSSSRTSSRLSQRTPSRSENMVGDADKAFLETIKTFSQEKNFSATQHFCLRVADSLDRLPRNVRNKLELDILQKVNEAENMYLSE